MKEKVEWIPFFNGKGQIDDSKSYQSKRKIEDVNAAVFLSNAVALTEHDEASIIGSTN